MNLASPRTAGKSRRHALPPCSRLGPHCQRLPVILRVGSLDEGPTSLDHEATWLLGHTAHIAFGELWEGDGDLYLDATLHVPCRYLQTHGGHARCAAHGFAGRAPAATPPPVQPRRLGGNRFLVVDAMRTAIRDLRPPRGALPVLNGDAGGGGDGGGADNPCAVAPCRTADNVRGAACCRDLQVEIMCTRRQTRLEALVRARQSPYLCKVTRPGDYSIEAELISACAYLADDGIACALHGRSRGDGRPAKPDLCSDWPPKGKGLHPGCVFGPTRRTR
ncbi:MAG TPA: hypothetical protein VFU46_15015 [Gemmatimonadales bacterium]|nr:hypothetical protein [Gemmatimonadales bacterium]